MRAQLLSQEKFRLFRNPTQVVLRSLLVLLMLAASGCRHGAEESPMRLTTAVLQDRNGFSETISQRDRLARIQEQDFAGPQSYQKVIRVFSRGEDGAIPSILTTYHPNGQLHHWLEVSNGRALGRYEQHYPDGKLRMEAQIVGGVADLTETAMTTWQFEGESRVYYPSGTLQATIPYKQGSLDGSERHFHPNGQLARLRQFSRGVAEGSEEEWSENGHLLVSAHIHQGQRHGLLARWDEKGVLLDEESWSGGRLLQGRYSDGGALGTAVKVGVDAGRGWSVDRRQQGCLRLVEIQDGQPRGWVRAYTHAGRLDREWEQEGGDKHGVERVYDPKSGDLKLEMHWVEGMLSGPCKSFYPSGSPESCWDMLDNQRHGRLVAWYRNGAVMLLEEYDRGKLLKGEYFGMGQTLPVSRVNQGQGVATLHHADGRLIRAVSIQDGEPAP
jgi:antitoxin component YwqK of YwqJK toxin-antitoxin module